MLELLYLHGWYVSSDMYVVSCVINTACMPQVAVGMPGDCLSVLAVYKHVLICYFAF